MTEYSAPPSTWTPPYGTWGSQQPTWVAGPPPRRRRPWLVVLVVVLSILGIGVTVGVIGAVSDEVEFGAKDRTPLHTPTTVGGFPRMTSAAADEAADEMTAQFSDRQDGHAGVYGRRGTPQYLLVAAFTLEVTGADVLAGFRDSAEKSARFGKITKVGDLTCQTVIDGALRGAACAWAGDRSNGMVWALHKTNIASLVPVTANARAEVDAR